MKRAFVLFLGSVLLSCAAPCPPAVPAPSPVCPPCDCDAQSETPLSGSSLLGRLYQVDWSQYQGDPYRHGRSPAPALRSPVIRWKKRVGIMGYLNTPIIYNDTVFVPSSGEKHNTSDPLDGVHAIDIFTGEVKWHTKFSNDANGAAAVGNRLIATSDDGHVYGLDIERGSKVWQRRGEGKMYSHPTVVDDLVVVGDSRGFVRAYAWEDGQERWTIPMKGAIRGGLASDGTFFYAVSQGGEVAAISKSGQLQWKKLIDGSTVEGYAAPIVFESALIVPFARDTTYSHPAFVSFDTRTGAVRWRAQDSSNNSWGNVRATPALVDGLMVYAETYSGDVAGIDASTGRVRYRVTVGACHFPHYGSGASAEDLVYIPRMDGVLYAVEAASGRVVWRMALGDGSGTSLPLTVPAPKERCGWETNGGTSLYSPVGIASDGTIIVGNGAGMVFAISGSS